MTKNKPWVESEIKNGYGEVQLSSWQDYMDYVHQKMLDYETYIWRGQRCDNWDLTPTLDRLLNTAKISVGKRYFFISSHLDQFKYSVRGRRGSNPPVLEKENDWWALGQHYGLATPLLDWTTSPFVAAYFAFIGKSQEQSDYRSIYALHKPSVENRSRELFYIATNEHEENINKGNQVGLLSGMGPQRHDIEFIKPLTDENQRLVNQGGLFSRAPNGIPLTNWVDKNFPSEKNYIIMKINIPNQDREECLKSLNRMNINHLTLFPDLYGASKFCNLFGEIEQY